VGVYYGTILRGVCSFFVLKTTGSRLRTLG
jgi:hypothetical protein